MFLFSSPIVIDTLIFKYELLNYTLHLISPGGEERSVGGMLEEVYGHR